MTRIPIIAAMAAAMTLAFALTPASARPCEDDNNAACVTGAAQASPMKLDRFMNTWKPVGVSKRGKTSKSVRHRTTGKAVASARKPMNAEPAPATEAVTPESTAKTESVAARPELTSETDGVAVTSFNEPNELDAAADRVRVVAFNEINDIDLAAPPAPTPAPTETVGQSVTTEETPADNSWIGKLLLAAAGTIAVAGATRLLVAQTA